MGPLPLEVSARIFATLAIKADADSAFAAGSQLAVARASSGGAGTILLEDDLKANLAGEFSPPTIEGFLDNLREGRLNDCRYGVSNGSFQTPVEGGPKIFLSREEVIRGMDPRSDEIKSPRSANPNLSVALTRGMILLQSIQNISADVFGEAALRALGQRAPEAADLLWLHAGDGELQRMTVTAPLLLTSVPPVIDPAMVSRGSSRFPVITIEARSGVWDIREQYVYGSLPLREVVLSTLVHTQWPVRFISKIRGKPSKPLLPVLRPEGPRSLRRDRAIASEETPSVQRLRRFVIADFFFENEAPTLPAPGRLIAMTKPNIALSSLKLIPEEIFEKAVRWGLGHEPKTGDRLVLSAGASFQKKGKIRNCLILCPKVPHSRSAASYPKVWMEFRGDHWVLLPTESEGEGSQEMIAALLEHTSWNIAARRSET